MNKQNTIFKKKELALAVSIAMLGGAMTGCSSDGDSSGPASYTISATGGSGYRGGNGNGIEIYNNGGTGGVVVSTSGKANTDFTSPIIAGTANLGSNPLEITADTTIDDMATLYSPVAGGGVNYVAPGALYVGTDDILYMNDNGDSYAGAAGYAGYANDTMVDDNSYYRSTGNTGELYQAVGDDNVADVAAADILYMGSYGGLYVTDGYAGAADPRISGIYVAANKTLTLGLDNSGSNTYINVNNDIDNRGTITKRNPGDNSVLGLNAHHYLGGGKLNNAGNANRRNGGEVQINALSITTGDINVSGYDDNSGMTTGNGGSFAGYGGAYVLNNGNIDASGGDVKGAFAGEAGSVHMYAAYVENNGNIDISGGNDTSDGAEWGAGGHGGTVNLRAGFVTNNTGDIDASGGKGGAGGRGGNVNFSNERTGEVKNAGNINLSGGSADDGDGGYGGSFDMHTHNGDTLNSGNINAAAGSTTDSGSGAGWGGDIEIYTTESASYGGGSTTGTGDVVVSGNLDVSGGDATADSGYGGRAGSVDIYNELGYGGGNSFGGTRDQRVALLGYRAINANGGDGTYAGDGARSYGGVAMYADSSANSTTNEVTFGSVSNEVAVNAAGGNGSTSGSSGYGGRVTLAASGNDYSGYGGYGGYGGPVALLDPVSTPDLVGEANVTNSGAINVSGGDGGEFGGWAGDTGLFAYGGMATNSGAVEATGGKGDDFGGRGGDIEIVAANAATNQAALSVDGGNGALFGGDGGFIAVMAMNPVNATSSGNITYSFGTGSEANGDEGCAIIGLNQLGSCNMMPN